MPSLPHQSQFHRSATGLKRIIAATVATGTAANALAGSAAQLAVATHPRENLLAHTLAVLGVVAGFALGVVYRSMSTARDVLQRKADNADAELQALLTVTNDAIFLLDPNGTVRATNPAAEELFSRDGDDLVGDDLANLIAQAAQPLELTRNGPAYFKTNTSGPQPVQVDVAMSPVQLRSGTSFLVLIRETGAAIPALPVNETPDLTGPVGKFSHDLNNILTAIIGNLSLILMTAPADPQTATRVTEAKKSAIRAQTLNRKLLALAKGEDVEVDQPFAPPSTAAILPMPSMLTNPNPPTATGAPRVLVVDDEEAVCTLVAIALGTMGYDVTEAATGERAVELCEIALQTGAPFQLVISDLSLPGQLGGLETVRAIRSLTPRIKAIVSSGYDTDPVMCQFRDHGFDAAIAKPYEISKLSRVVADVLGDEASRLRTA